MAAAMVESGRPLQMSYFHQADARPPQAEQGYDDVQLGPDSSRKGSDASFVTMGPGAAHMGNFSLAALHDQFSMRDDAVPRTHAYRTSDVSSVASSMVPQGVGPPSNVSARTASAPGQPNALDGMMTPPAEKGTGGEKQHLNSPEEIHFMQVFISEVGIWMDSLDKDKHFSRIIPIVALKSPMLLNAFLACGVKHLTLINPEYKEDRALFYYDTATTQLLRSLQNPDRDMAECATTAVVLNVYEIMSEQPKKRMNHIAGARALIRECKWNATSTGIGAACFWLNIGMEVLSCLSFNWQTAWDPDQWGLDMDFLRRAAAGGEPPSDDGHANGHSLGGGGEDEAWTHRMFYIVAKLANFKANIPKFQEQSAHDEQVRLQSRFEDWQRLKALCDAWNTYAPRSMKPFGYLPATETNTTSAFPNVWYDIPLSCIP